MAERATSAPPDDPAPRLDVVLPAAVSEDGQAVQVVRVTDSSVALGELRPLTEGRPIHGEVVRLTPRDDLPRPAWNVEIVVPGDPVRPSTPPRAHAGPPQIATPAYRRNWQAIFGDPELN